MGKRREFKIELSVGYDSGLPSGEFHTGACNSGEMRGVGSVHMEVIEAAVIAEAFRVADVTQGNCVEKEVKLSPEL